jgi:hypothetical protein
LRLNNSPKLSVKAIDKQKAPELRKSGLPLSPSGYEANQKENTRSLDFNYLRATPLI